MVAVGSWDGLLDALEIVSSEPFVSDLAQFRAMYRALSGYEIEPIPSDDAVRAWRDREGVYINLVDLATRRLTQGKLMTIGPDSKRDPKDYVRRYVCRPLRGKPSCFSVGARDPFPGYITPIWLRFHSRTHMFLEIRSRIAASNLSGRVVDSGRHIWLPLNVPLNVEGDGIVDSLVAQGEEIAVVAYDGFQ